MEPSQQQIPAPAPGGSHEPQRLAQLIVEASPDLLYIYGRRSGHTLYANRELTAALGYGRDDGHSTGACAYTALAHPDDMASVLAFNARVRAAEPGELRGQRYRVRHADGSYRWIYRREAPLAPGPDGESLILGVAQEITAQRQAEMELLQTLRDAREEWALLDTLLGSAPIGFDFVDRELRYVRINEALAANNGRSVAEHIGRTVREVLPELADTIEPLLRQVIASGEPIIDREVQGMKPGEPGAPRIWRESLYPVRGADGQVIGVGAIVTEITEHRRASVEREQLMRAAEASAARTASLQAITAALAPVLTRAQVAAVIVEAAVQALHASSGALALLTPEGDALQIAHAAGLGPGSLEHSPITLDAADPLADAVRAGAPVLVGDLATAEARYPRMARRAGLQDAAWASVPLLADGRAEGALSLGFDAPQQFSADDTALLQAVAQQCAQALERARLYEAEQRARAEAERAVRERDELIALISHDLKNPLTVIQGQAMLLERRLGRGAALEPEQLGHGLTRIHEAASRMTVQIEELLDVALLRAGRALPLDLQPTDLVVLAGRAAQLAQANTERHTLRLVCAEAQLLCPCDGPRVERGLSNLLSNAVKYSPDGGSITVSLGHERDDTGAWAVIAVSDSGIGIPAADLPRIFERFHRAANAAGQIHGTGLGLASVQRIVEQHGGSIMVRSVEGEGSTFTLRLPLG
jgi:PAS domain S-box-containing protein